VGFEDDGRIRVFVYWIDREQGICCEKRENVFEEDLIRENQDRLFESRTQRFGDGKIIASIPLNIFYRDFAPRLKQGDQDYLKWALNHENNRPWRRFRGRV